MATPYSGSRAGLTNEYGKPIGDNIDNWFEYGVKAEQQPIKSGFCTNKQTLYVLAAAIGFVVLAVVIIVPAVIGTIKKS